MLKKLLLLLLISAPAYTQTMTAHQIKTQDYNDARYSNIDQVNILTISNRQAAPISVQSAAGTGATAVCAVGATCTPNYGLITLTLGTGPTAGDQVAVTWSTAFNHKAVCHFDVFDNTSSTILTSNWIMDSGSSNATQGMAYASGGLTAAHSLLVIYQCW